VSAKFSLHHPDGCSIEFEPLPDDMMRMTSKRGGREPIVFPDVGVELGRLYYKGWLKEGFMKDGTK